VWQYNLNIQQQIGDSSVVSLGYTGHRGNHETSLGDYNVPTAVFNGSSYEFPATAKKLNPNFEGINLSKTNARSWYNALLLSFQKRLSAGLQMQVSYTYSKLIDQSDSDIKASEVGAGGGTLKYVYDLNAQRALSAYDIRNVLSVNYTYDLPVRVKGPVGAVVSGWRVSGIVKVQDGQPFSVNRTGSSFLTGLSGSPGLFSPNLVPGFTSDRSSGEIRTSPRTPRASADTSTRRLTLYPACGNWATSAETR